MSDLINRLRHIGTPETIVGEVEDLQAEVERLEKDLAKSQERVEELGIQQGNLIEKFSRLLYITGQLTMLRDKEGDEYKKLYAEYIEMKYPELKTKAEGQEVEG
jgi:predicted nuclease with TOPRIM domain